MLAGSPLAPPRECHLRHPTFHRHFADFMYKELGHFDNYVGHNFKVLRAFFNWLNKEKAIELSNIDIEKLEDMFVDKSQAFLQVDEIKSVKKRLGL